MPWTANLSLSVAMPLPFTKKGFRPDGSLTNLEAFWAESNQLLKLVLKQYEQP